MTERVRMSFKVKEFPGGKPFELVGSDPYRHETTN
jgi:hypothetical protein